MTAVDARTANLLDPAWWADLDGMHRFFTWAREEAPLWRDEANGLWAVTRHHDILDVERRSDVFSSRGCYRANVTLEETNTIALDDPEHLQQRRIVNRRFTPRAVEEHHGLLQDRIDEIVDRVTPAGQLEVVHELAGQLPSRVTAALLGFPEDRWEDVKSWSERLMRTDSLFVDSDAMAGMMSAIMEFSAVLGETAAARRGCPADDLVSAWVEAGLDDMSLMHETGLFIAGGAETTRTAIARGLAILAEHPDQWEAAAEDPSLVPGMVEEVIRWVTPLNNMFRTATRDDEVGGRPVSAGDRFLMAYPSANRDEAVFDDPFRFDIRRDPNPHLAFGNGTHFCIGANLARLELRLLFGTLTQRWRDLRVVTPPDIEPNIFAGAVRRFDLAFAPR
ncbi:MAG TPA: cytochrome P450 [Acidimicrobiales bacterium]|nr:cytochrome P450 [Acidimicrobiales bacterium]